MYHERAINSTISTVQFVCRIIRNWWRADWVRVEYFPRAYLIGNAPENPGRSAKSRSWTSRTSGSNHLHVYVQRHRLDQERKFREMYFEFRSNQELRGDSRKVIGHSLDQETKRSGTADGWITCARFMGCGDRSIVLQKQYENPTNPAAGNRCETGTNSRNTAKSKRKETEMLISCWMQTMFPQTHIPLKANLSCTLLRTTKQ